MPVVLAVQAARVECMFGAMIRGSALTAHKVHKVLREKMGRSFTARGRAVGSVEHFND